MHGLNPAVPIVFPVQRELAPVGGCRERVHRPCLPITGVGQLQLRRGRQVLQIADGETRLLPELLDDLLDRAVAVIQITSDAMPTPRVVLNGTAALEQSDPAAPGKDDGDNLPGRGSWHLAGSLLHQRDELHLQLWSTISAAGSVQLPKRVRIGLTPPRQPRRIRLSSTLAVLTRSRYASGWPEATLIKPTPSSKRSRPTQGASTTKRGQEAGTSRVSTHLGKSADPRIAGPLDDGGATGTGRTRQVRKRSPVCDSQC